MVGLWAAPSWTTESDQAFAAFGWAVDAAGDVNRDGYADFLIGADEYEVGGIAQAGRVYLYLGSGVGPSAEPDWTADGTQAYARFGHDVGLAGDVNGDGFLELIIGEQRYSNGEMQEGRALLYEAHALAQTETTISYEYDPLYRLTQASYAGSIEANYNYVYDAVGNMTTYTETVGITTTIVGRTFDAANRLQTAMDTATGTTSYYFDGNGNLVQILPPGVTPGDAGEQLYSYDQRNLLTNNTIGVGSSVYNSVADYVYDGAGNRVQQVDHTGSTPITTTYSNDNLGLSQVLAANDGTTTTYNLFGLDLIHQDDGTTTRTLLADGLGSARTEMVGSAVETVTTYEPFGNLLTQTGTSGTVYGFTGEQYDASTGLLYLRARYYNSGLRAFMSRDAWQGNMKRPMSYNPWLYVYANPINHIDPTGHCGADPIGAKNLLGFDLTPLCIDLRAYLDTQFGLSIQGEWTFHEMDLFDSALRDMVRGFGSTHRFVAFFAGTNVVRYRRPGGSEVSWPPNEVKIENNQFRGDNFARWMFIHEFGHRFDVRSQFEASMALQYYTGSKTTTLCFKYIEVLGICQYTVGGNTVSGYGEKDRREDWAESFAATMFDGNWTALVAIIHIGSRPMLSPLPQTELIVSGTFSHKDLGQEPVRYLYLCPPQPPYHRGQQDHPFQLLVPLVHPYHEE